MQVAAVVLCLAATATGVALFVKAVARFGATFRLGRPDPTRTGSPGRRTLTLGKEFLGHTRMSRLPVVAVAHWFVMVSFGLLFFTLVTAFGQLFSPDWALPLIGHLFLLEWAIDAIAWLSLLGCSGAGTVYRFAQIVVAATLALEISASAAMATAGSENFFRAHHERGGLR